jgi:hypothetical protein
VRNLRRLLPALLLTGACTSAHTAGPPPIALVPGCASAVFSDGDVFCVVRKSDGRVSCGAIGVGPVTMKPVPGPVSPTSIGFFQADRCATLTDGSVSCWSDGAGTFGPTAAVDPNLSHAVAAFPVGYSDAEIKLGALTSDGDLVWEDGFGKLTGAGTNLAQFAGSPSFYVELGRDGALSKRDLEDPRQLLPAGSGAVAFGGDFVNMCYLDHDAKVSCGRYTFQPMIEDAAQLSGLCATKKDGSLWCWDEDASYQLTVPVDTAPPHTVVTLTNGCAIFTGGSVYCWKGTALPSLVTTACD